ncbi:MAG: C45 family autoproteolytic acyltransferase/hydrolase [Solirubrobacterales bacterium]
MKKVLAGVLGFILIVGAFYAIPELSERKLSYTVVRTEGTAYEVGYAEGKQILKQNPDFANTLRNPFFLESNSRNFNRVLVILKKYDPQLLEEMRGFSDATGIPYQDVVTKLSTYGFRPPLPFGCTQMAVLSKVTGTGHTLVGRNYDFSDIEALTDRLLIVQTRSDSRSTLGMSQHVFGRYEGINQDGVYVGISAGWGKGRTAKGFFFPMVVRVLLDQSQTADDAVALLKRLPLGGSYNYLIADPDHAYVVEVSPPRIAVRQPENCILAATNHYVATSMRKERMRVMANSTLRYRTVIQALNETPPINLARVEKVLSSHGTEGVCMHAYATFLGTMWSAAFDLEKGKAYYSFGAPCRNPFREISLQAKPGKQSAEDYEAKLPPSDWKK